MGIYKKKQESEKKRNKNSTNKVIKKKRKFFLGRYLGRVLVFFLFFLFSWPISWSSSCFLVFLIAFLVEFLFSCLFQYSYLTLKLIPRRRRLISPIEKHHTGLAGSYWLQQSASAAYVQKIQQGQKMYEKKPTTLQKACMCILSHSTTHMDDGDQGSFWLFVI